eukprot:gene6691-6383_t
MAAALAGLVVLPMLAAASGDDISAAAGGDWQPVFVLESTAKTSSAENQGYFAHINGWTNSWASVELGPANRGGVRLRVTRVGDPSGASVVSISGDMVEVLVPRPARFTLTLDGGLDDVDARGDSYAGPPVHTFCAF